MAKLHPDRNPEQGHWHWCPGCDELHCLPQGWTFNGDLEKPTFSPSFKHTWSNRTEAHCCHYILTDGILNFCGDSTHKLASQNVPLPEIPAGKIERWGLA